MIQIQQLSSDKESRISFWLSWLIILISFCYPITTAIPMLTGIASTPFNIFLRTVYLSIALVILIPLIKKRYLYKLNHGQWAFLFFWILYAIRLIYDVSFRGVKYSSKDAFYIYSFAFGSCFIPSFAVLLGAKHISFTKMVNKMYIIFVLASIIILYLYLSNTQLQIELLSQRAELKQDSVSDESSILNPITISNCGELLFLGTLIKLLFFPLYRFERLLLPIFLIVGAASLIIGGSRGPFVFTILLSVLCIFLFFKKKRLSPVLILKSLFGLLLAIISCFKLIFYFSDIDFVLFTRFVYFFDNAQDNVADADPRGASIIGAWHQFLDNPIIGDQFVGKLDNFYPHNIYVEVLMSLGIIGGVIFFYFHVFTIWKLYKCLNSIDRYYLFIGFIGLIQFLDAVLSGCLFEGGNFWLFSALFAGCFISKKNNHETIIKL